MKKLILGVVLLFMVACAGMTPTQVANTILFSAEQYYAINHAAFSPEDAIKYETFLAGLELAISTGQGVESYVKQWQDFMGERK